MDMRRIGYLSADSHKMSAPPLEWTDWSSSVAPDHFLSTDLGTPHLPTSEMALLSISTWSANCLTCWNSAPTNRTSASILPLLRTGPIATQPSCQ